LGHVARVAGIDHGHGKSGRGERGNHGSLLAARGFEHHEGGLYGLEPRHQGGHASVIMGHGPPFAGGPHGHIELGFRHIHTHKTLWSRHQAS
jgi:hypothetical protein